MTVDEGVAAVGRPADVERETARTQRTLRLWRLDGGDALIVHFHDGRVENWHVQIPDASPFRRFLYQPGL